MYEIETWRPIPNWSYYEVSDWGRVRRIVGGQGAIAGKILSAEGREPAVCLRQEGRFRYEKISRLVLLAFVGPCPPGLEGCHTDDNKKNNYLSNLRWDTHKANGQDALRNGLMLIGEKNPKAKITEKQVLAIRDEYVPGRRGPGIQVGSIAWLANKYNVSRDVIMNVVSNRNWKHVPVRN